jgi:hypothetical protein
MATTRPRKTDQLIFADVTDSKAKAGVWFQETKSFKSRQKKILNTLKEQIDWVALPNAILAISDNPAGVVLIAPNPTLPGVFVVANGTTEANTLKLQRRYSKLVETVSKDAGADPLKSTRKK